MAKKQNAPDVPADPYDEMVAARPPERIKPRLSDVRRPKGHPGREGYWNFLIHDQRVQQWQENDLNRRWKLRWKSFVFRIAGKLTGTKVECKREHPDRLYNAFGMEVDADGYPVKK